VSGRGGKDGPGGAKKFQGGSCPLLPAPMPCGQAQSEEFTMTDVGSRDGASNHRKQGIWGKTPSVWRFLQFF